MTLGLDVQIKTGPSGYVVERTKMKSYLNVDYDLWDSLIDTLILSATTRLERYTGCSFQTKTLVATFMSVADNVEIPYGPIQSITKVKSIDENGNKILLTEGSDYVIYGNNFKTIKFFEPGQSIEIEYVAGYQILPADLQVAVMKQVAMDFEYRENTAGKTTVTELSNGAKQFANSYRRILMF